MVNMNLMEEQCVEDLADPLYHFLPGSGNSRTAFSIAAAMVQSQVIWDDVFANDYINRALIVFLFSPS